MYIIRSHSCNFKQNFRFLESHFRINIQLVLFFYSLFPACAAPSSMVLGRVFAKWRAVLFCTKSYFPLVGGTSPIPLNSLTGWLRNSYESLFSSVGNFFRNEKRGEPASLKPTDSPQRIIE